jgi:hypothetical protein
MNRAFRREIKRKERKQIRRIPDHSKILKFLIFGLKVLAGSAVILAGFWGFKLQKQNGIRESVLDLPVQTTGHVTEVVHRKMDHHVKYSFQVNGKPFSGKSFRGMDLKMNSEICIFYYKRDPITNLPCGEMSMENWWDSVFEPLSLCLSLMSLVFLLLIPGAFVASFLTGNPKYAAEFTKRG